MSQIFKNYWNSKKIIDIRKGHAVHIALSNTNKFKQMMIWNGSILSYNSEAEVISEQPDPLSKEEKNYIQGFHNPLC